MNQADLTFIEKKINLARGQVYSAASILFQNDSGLEEIHPQEVEFSRNTTWEELKNFYHLIVIYLEVKSLHNYLSDFKIKYNGIINDEKEATKIVSLSTYDGDYYEDLYLLVEWNLFLNPFRFYNETKTTEYKKLIGLLECTNEILKITDAKPEKEDDINRVMREVAGFYYEGVTAYSEGYFRHQFKSYKPDIIIREIETSVEYKLIRTNEELGNKIDELIIDAKRYTDNFNNKNCVAVFCLCKSVTTIKKRISEDWDKMKFPQNWELVIISDVELKEKGKNN